MTETNNCENCGGLIGALETHHVWEQHVVCQTCWSRLSATPAAATSLPHQDPLANKHIKRHVGGHYCHCGIRISGSRRHCHSINYCLWPFLIHAGQAIIARTKTSLKSPSCCSIGFAGKTTRCAPARRCCGKLKAARSPLRHTAHGTEGCSRPTDKHTTCNIHIHFAPPLKPYRRQSDRGYQPRHEPQGRDGY